MNARYADTNYPLRRFHPTLPQTVRVARLKLSLLLVLWILISLLWLGMAASLCDQY